MLAAGCDMVLEAVAADVLHEFLEIRNLGNSDAAVHSVRIVGDYALAEISLDLSLGVVGGDAEEGEVAFGNLCADSAEGTHLAEGTAKHSERGELQVLVADETAGEVAAVGADTLLTVGGEVVVPVHEGGGLHGSEGKRVHGDGSGDVGLAGTRDKLVAEHGHSDAGGAAIVHLEGVPALDCEGVALVGGGPSFDCHGELGDKRHLLLVVGGDVGIFVDAVFLGDIIGIVVGDLLGCENQFGKVCGNDGDAVFLEEFFAGAAGVETERTGADLADAAVTETVHHAADACELGDVALHEGIVYVVGVICGVGEGNSVLVKVVADRNLAAESVAAAIEVNLVVVIVVSLYKDGDAQIGFVDGVDDSDFETEVGKGDDDAVDVVSVFLELGGHLKAVFTGLDAGTSGRGSILGEDHIVIIQLV